jgi:Flp pilus assembly protein TadG
MGGLKWMRKQGARMKAALKHEGGAEAVEFAFIGPLLFFLVLAIFYVLFLVAAQVSVARSASVGVRYAAIFDKSLNRYPTSADIQNKVLDNAFLFRSGACTTDTANSVGLGAGAPNAPIKLSITCEMANPAGQAVAGLRNAFFGGGGSEGAATFELKADARARRE